ncbi:MAG: FAD:protein FMN transferase [Phycisphaerales bacterium]|nr:MAG: FAD:protein FMN transferase [Phycisphaerales bacterium]
MDEPQEQTSWVRSECESVAGMKRFYHEAMATTFEVIVIHEDGRYAQQAAAAAFREVDRLEGELSRFVENSDISRINSLPADQPLVVGPDAFECLRLSVQLYGETNGAFDVTVGSLLGCWRNDDGSARTPTQDEIDLARRHTGGRLIELDEVEHTVCLAEPVKIDLGGVGKGYAVDRMAELLRDWSIDVALIHGGYSSVLALEAPADMKGWPLTLSHPGGGGVLVRPRMKGRALSGSGRRKGGHIIDPRTAKPAEGRVAAWSSAPDAATGDALSTAFMIMQADEIKQYCLRRPDVLAMTIVEEGGGDVRQDRILRFGNWRGELHVE